MKCPMLLGVFRAWPEKLKSEFFSKNVNSMRSYEFFLNGSIYFWCSFINANFGRIYDILSHVWRSKYPRNLFPTKICIKIYKTKVTSFFTLYSRNVRFTPARLVFKEQRIF